MINYPKAFIFDLDGVITDTSEYHYLAWKKLADELGIKINQEFNEQLKGIGRIQSLERILELAPSKQQYTTAEKEKIANRKNEYYQELIKTINSSNILPGILVLLEKVRGNNIPIALGSASRNAPIVLELLGLSEYFDYLVDASKVTNGKPHPETFTTAADYFNLAYDTCVGIEDATAGVEALNNANMFAVGVGDMKYLAAADYVVENTSLLSFKEIVKNYSDWESV